ncbi:MAG TPA: hypothetical protein VF234_03835, partial [Limnochordia bacterium]
MRRWWRLYCKDLASQRGALALLLGAIAVWLLFLHSRAGLWDPALVTALSWMPLSFVIPWALWMTVSIHKSEWEQRTCYLLLSLPIPAWQILLSKLAAIATQLLILVVVIDALALWNAYAAFGQADFVRAWALLPAEARWLALRTAVIFGALWAVGIGLFLSLAQAAYLVGRLVDRFSGLLSGGAFLV